MNHSQRLVTDEVRQWGRQDPVTEVENEAWTCQSMVLLGVFAIFAHLSLAFDLVTRRDLIQ